MHSTGAGNVKAQGYPYDEVARAWQGVKERRRSRHKERKPHKEKDERKRKGRPKILHGEGNDDLSDLSDLGLILEVPVIPQIPLPIMTVVVAVAGAGAGAVTVA